MIDSVAAGNQLTNMLPGHTSSWWPIVEDVFSAPSAVNMEKRLLEESVQNGECTFISIDGTFRVCLPLMGQAKFTEPKAVRDTYPFPDHESFKRVISTRGRTGAVLGLLPAIDEAAHTAAACIQACLPYGGVQQVEHIASDNPSHKLFTTLMEALPCLKSIALDPTHAAMRYEQASHGRRTRGSQLLRRLMVKFTTHDQAVTTNIWGPFYDGLPGHKLSGQEQSLRDAILDGSMSTARARRVLGSVEYLRVWPTRIQFIEAVAALSSENRSELDKKLEGTKVTVGKMLFQLTSVDRMEWLFNNLRQRYPLPHHVRVLLPSGTTSNEALHAELNSAFRQIQHMHRSTLQLKLRLMRLAKLLAHNSALYSPTSRQMPSAHVLARRIGQALWTAQSWREWVKEQDLQKTARRFLPLASQREQEQEAIKQCAIQRKPAAQRKRTAFTLERSTSVRRSGVHLRKPASKKRAGEG